MLIQHFFHSDKRHLIIVVYLEYSENNANDPVGVCVIGTNGKPVGCI